MITATATTNNMDDFLNNEMSDTAGNALFSCKSRATSQPIVLVAGSEDASFATLEDVSTAEPRARHILIVLLDRNLLTQEDSSERGCLNAASLPKSQQHIWEDCLQDLFSE